MNKKSALWVALLQVALVVILAIFYKIADMLYFVYAAASIVQFALLSINKLKQFFLFTLIYGLLAAAILPEYSSALGYLSGLLWFVLIALFNFLIVNMLEAEQYKSLYFGTFILWIIAFGAIYAMMNFINIIVLNLEAMPEKREIANVFINHMKTGIIMGIALGLGYDVIKLYYKLRLNGDS